MTSISSSSSLVSPTEKNKDNLLTSPKAGISQYFKFLEEFKKSSLPEELRAVTIAQNSLRSLQKRAIFAMLNDASDVEGTSDASWIILILDARTQQILAPSIDIDELRSRGVTLFLPIEKEIPSLPDTISCYFIEPTAENIRSLTSCDLVSLPRQPKTYDFNFCGSISRENLEDLAQGAAVATVKSSSKVTKVVDRLVNFISLEEDLFSLGLESSFTIMSKAIANLHDESVMKLVEDCSNGLLSVAVTFEMANLAILPLQCGSSAFVNLLVRRLQSKIRDFYLSAKNRRPKIPSPPCSDLMLLFDRNQDLISPLRHKWSYGALVHDFFPVRLNRILSLGKEESAQLLLSWKDPIWKHASRLSFPDACTLFGDELQTYQKAYAQISGGDGDEIEPLRKALEEIPALREKKHWIDTHLLLASALLPQISQRRPDLFRELETAQPSANISLPELDPIDEGDRIRLLLVVFLSSGKDQRLLPFLIEKFSLKESASLAKALHAIVPEFTMASSLSDSTSPNATPNDIPEQKVSIFETLSTSGNVVASSRIAKMVMQGIQRISNQVLSPSGDDDALMPIIRYVDAALRGEGESRMPVTAGSSMLPKRLVVFVVGGIAYDEYQSLSAFLARNWPGIEVAIGGTSLCSSSDFLAQLYQTGGRDSETHPNATCS